MIDLGRHTSLTDWLNGKYIMEKYIYKNYEVTEFIQDGTLMFIVKTLKEKELLIKLVREFPIPDSFELHASRDNNSFDKVRHSQRQIEFHHQTGETKLWK